MEEKPRASRIDKYKNDCYTNRPKPEDTKWRPGAPYISNGGQEYVISRQGNFFSIHRYNGGQIPKKFKTSYTSFQEAEKHLVVYLKKGDRNGYARYPGKESKYAPFNG